MDYIAYGEDSGYLGRFDSENTAVEALGTEYGWVYRYIRTVN
jgi:hypothetical protein